MKYKIETQSNNPEPLLELNGSNQSHTSQIGFIGMAPEAVPNIGTAFFVASLGQPKNAPTDQV